ncbi:hypothetical protein BD413DRAFT_124573 [Trametes elegans]|nr:hypothetical protein BD413DRAFT_124573 [Trametes elegans]
MSSAQSTNGIHHKSDNSASSPGASLEADIALLSSLLSQDLDGSDPDVAELLERLDAAEGIADGVESRLNGVIDHLDGLLSELETRTAPAQEDRSSVPVSAAVVAEVEEEVVVTSPKDGTPTAEKK